MLPAVLKNVHQINNFVIKVMEKSHLTFHFKGPWLTKMNFLVTVDPTNVHHVFSKSYENYVKGPKFNEIFEVLGDGIFNADSTLWRYHRKMAQSYFGHPNFHSILASKIQEELENRLFPVLDHVCDHDIEIDLQDLFKRFTYDNISAILLDHDPKFLCVDFPPMPLSIAVADLEEVVFKRHVVPAFIWKYLGWLIFGDKKYKKACEVRDGFIYNCIAKKREDMSRGNIEVSMDLLSLYMADLDNTLTLIKTNGDKFLRDTFLNFFVAGGDTTSVFSWFFYILSKNPLVIVKIREEQNSLSMQNSDTNVGFPIMNFIENCSKLVYLHAVLCEVLRMYPPLVFNHKTSVKSDILPSGHQVNPNMQIIFDKYAMGRMKCIWGDDCNEFKPERWITEQGNVKHEPTYKFLAFGAGPRSCQGKDMVFTQMKAVIAATIQKYDIKAVEGHKVVPDISIVLQMKHGFKVKMTRSQH